MERAAEKHKQAQTQKISNLSSGLKPSTSILSELSSSSQNLIPNINNFAKADLNMPEKLTTDSLWNWLKAQAIQKAKKYTITVILLPNIIQSLIKSATERYYGHQVEFVLVGILVSVLNFTLVSYFLYKWFVTGEGGIKEITKNKLAQVQKIKQQVESYFIPGNQGNLLKLYCLIVFAGLLSYILPDAVFKGGLGLVSDLYKEIKSYIMNKYKSTIDELQQKFYQNLLKLLASLPKYSDYVKNQSTQKGVK